MPSIPAITQRLGNLLNPSSSSLSSSKSETLPSKASPSLFRSKASEAESAKVPKSRQRHTISGVCQSQIASSCELFGMLKALAAGGNDAHAGTNEGDSDEDEEACIGGLPQRTESAATLRPTAKTPTQPQTGFPPEQSTVPDSDPIRGREETPISTNISNESPVDTEEKKRRVLLKWVDDTMGKMMRDREAIGSRFTALSLSNFSPLSSREDDAKAGGVSRRHRPALPHIFPENPTHSSPDQSDTEESDNPELEPQTSTSAEESPETTGTAISADDSSTLAESTSGGPEIQDSEQIFSGSHLGPVRTDAEKLSAIVEEFGPVDQLMVNADDSPSEPERLLAESKGSLFKGIMMVGNLHLTTHRLLFHAVLPPDAAFTAPSEASAMGNDLSFSSVAHQSDVLQAGPVTLHRNAALRPPRRVWMELSAEMVTTYPSGDEAGRVRPLRCLLLSSIRRMEPLDLERPCDFHVTYETPDGPRVTFFSVDTEQSAIAWRRQFEAALFRHARVRWRENEAAKHGVDNESVAGFPNGEQWSMMRCCLPLDRVNLKGVVNYHSFATLVGLEVELSDGETVDWHPERIAQGDFMSSLEGDKTYSSKRIPKLRTGSDSLRRTLDDRPLRRLSLKPGLGFLGRSPSARGTRDASPDRQNTSSPRSSSPRSSSPFFDASPVARDSTKSPVTKGTRYLDSTLPSHLIRPSLANPIASTGLDPTPFRNGDEVGRVFDFNVAVLQEQTWFATALEAAVKASALRKYKDGVKRPKMVLNIGGYDCLATDDESGMPAGVRDEANSAETLDLEEDEEMEKNSVSVQLRKEQTAAMAARLFGLKEDEGIWIKRCYVSQGLVPARGHIILTPRYICFWRRAAVGADIKFRFKCSDIKGADEVAGIRPAFHGMALHINGHHDITFEFWQKAARDEVLSRIRLLASSSTPASTLSSKSTPPQVVNSSSQDIISVSERQTSMLTASTASDGPVPSKVEESHAADILAPPKDAMFESRAFTDEALAYMPFVANKPWGATSRLMPRRFTMLTIGSRGDVQPYIALALRLMKDDHKVVIVTHDEFKGWIEGYGIEHRQAGGDPTALMKLSAEHKMFSPGFFKESLGSFRQWLDELLVDSWEACKDADILIESPSAMAGVHIAEALKIPYFRAFTMPWTRTTAYPQAFLVPAFEMGPSFNYSTYVLFDNIMWRATSGQINKWRKKYLGLASTDMSLLNVTKIPFLYNFSSAVVPKPLDWHDDITITGYWNLENSDTEWSPPQDLVDFMAKARADAKPLVYIGFGSIVVPRPNAMTKSIIKAVEKADVRAIIAKGWSSRGGDPAKEGEQIQFPASCYGLDKVPHGWLFPKIDAALHHGGAGTVGASLRAGIPTLIKPWFGDQYFWALRVTKLEVGLKVSSLRSDEVADALRKATSSKVMIEKAARVGERIRAENGVENALQAIHFNVVRAGGDRTKMRWGSK